MCAECVNWYNEELAGKDSEPKKLGTNSKKFGSGDEQLPLVLISYAGRTYPSQAHNPQVKMETYHLDEAQTETYHPDGNQMLSMCVAVKAQTGTYHSGDDRWPGGADGWP
ncbi:hypothetical protein L1987_25282 [Smallanthus sonchifolius]|uniref:Uncharacterized protein n=1 Tax=Smallanthus sonchifolius TaxID=185202 RepID=A0ACB9IPA7_9ASTR|nr:hypothetical protein L1987_25282 [Smallanthus sonchifolius]